MPLYLSHQPDAGAGVSPGHRGRSSCRSGRATLAADVLEMCEGPKASKPCNRSDVELV